MDIRQLLPHRVVCKVSRHKGDRSPEITDQDDVVAFTSSCQRQLLAITRPVKVEDLFRLKIRNLLRGTASQFLPPDVGDTVPGQYVVNGLASRRSSESQNARLAMVLALNTTMRACEIKALRWYDVDFLGGSVTIRRSKTEAGRRVIPLNEDALRAMRELYRRAFAIGGTQPDHYVFPACENGRFDPVTPQKSWRSAWRSLRKAAGIGALRFHDLRHHAITELAESQASDATIMAIAGHVSRQMLEHYSHVRLDLKRKALDELSTGRMFSEGKRIGYDTNYDTTKPSGGSDHDVTYGVRSET
jgi:integrase